ncbi:nucleoporin p58/p45-like [Amphibalanus amphitrite]|uniref:nucleoporin p58/p45-like n=1 Tax=Amphibalanus amphitrite TaxID=1232801 RepID=UPI001C9127FD|nr:nucleoporin p58/p45-like [Amphibalanus amphitrite]XP_043233374.1 nucleoporin p58/p45-like [Amphibalanus amphitrite]XP_043233378.1 nucleoporin p58/p45-like [Amphibalanus amphitrite]
MATGFSFGGTPASSASTGFSFGATPAASTGFSFGASAAKPAGTTLTLPTASSAGTGFSFGAAPAASTQASTGFGFGATPAASTQASTGFSFGATPAATSAAQPATGFSLGAPAATPAASTGFSFGSAAAPQPSTGFGLGTAVTSSAPALTLNLGGAAPASSAAVGLGGKLQVGLGGTVTALDGSGSGAEGKADGKAPKETDVPPEIVQTVREFEKHVKEQKAEGEQIARHSWGSVQNVGEETAALRRLLAAVEASVQRHAAAAAQLKQDVCALLKRAEVAQRTSEISAGLQHENTAPQELFERLVQQYEADMVTYRRQIDQLESLLAAADGTGFVSPEELMRSIRQLHETFVWLAGHLQTVHEKVQALKDHYLAYRRTVVGDTSDVFAARSSAAPARPASPPPPRPGPSPFAVDRNAAAAAVAQALGQPPPPVAAPAVGAPLYGATPAAAPAAGGLFGSGSTTFGAAAAANPFGTAGAGLKLDPPPGSKRGKTN